ncbi:penicillin-binding protein 1C [Moheibacter sediminis]|uniref:peptidoglycan glycosyltransferase n=1 Tax=Moheibacter sediminis TaxID=1434700 RepID=A0A1W2CGB8_9FLAO|nr:penicillin-binding protein 1C [Moheibacter sediminis]
MFRRLKSFIKKYKIPIGIIFVIFLIWYLFFSLPRPLFKQDTSTILYSEDNRLLGATISKDEQWRFPVSDSVPKRFEVCITQFEDAYFRKHPGVNPVSLFRAFRQNSSSGSVKSGGSTITMQTIRLAKQNPKRTYWQKFVEIIQATRLELTYSKNEILNYYASYAPFGGNVVGLDAAAWRYYAKPAHQLSWGECATLAVLPNAPSLIFPGKNHELLLSKRNRLLKKLLEEKILSEDDYMLALSEPLPLKPNSLPEIAPHLLHTSSKIHKGKRLHSTIDSNLQEQVNLIVENHKRNLSASEIHNIAVLVVEVETGNVKAYVGNTKDENYSYSNQVDIIQSKRSSGSILKPFLYASMLQDGQLLPKMLLNDTPIDITENYDKNYSGAVPADEALAKSLNIPAVHMLEKYSVAKFHHRLKQFGFTTFNKTPKHYGLSLIVGGGEVKVWELAEAYRNMAYALVHDDGKSFSQEIQFMQNENPKKQKYPISPQAAFLTLDALQNVVRPDSEAGWQVYSSKRIAWKTGTSHGFKDAWSVGVTPEYAVAIWVGNADGEGRPGIIGVKAAAPVMFDVFHRLDLKKRFRQPKDGWTEVKTCKESGYLLSPNCSHYIKQIVPKSGNNAEVCPYHKKINLDKTGNFRVDNECYPVDEMLSKSWFVLPAIQEYYYAKGHPYYQSLPPYLSNCNAALNEKPFDFIYPKNFIRIFLPVDFSGEQQAVVFEIAHSKPESKLFWHLDGKFIGTTQSIHKMPLLPEPGKHKIVVSDELGNRIEKGFTIVEGKE